MLAKKTFKMNEITPQIHIEDKKSEISKVGGNDNTSLLRLNSICMYEEKSIVEKFPFTYKMLISIGFSPRVINNCYRLYRCQNIREFIELLIKTDGKYDHEFIINETNPELCELCEESPDVHHIHKQVSGNDDMKSVSEFDMDNNLKFTKVYSKDDIEMKKTQTKNFLKKQSDLEKDKPSSTLNFYNIHTRTMKSIKIEDGKLEAVKEDLRKASNNDSSRTLKKRSTFPLKDDLNKSKGTNAELEVDCLRNNPELDGNTFDENFSADDFTNCEICEEKIFLPSIPPLYKLPCKHFFCPDCFDYYLENEITLGNVKTIRCPHNGCNIVLSKSDVSDLLLLTGSTNEEVEKKKNLNEKYLKFLKNHEVEDDKKKFYCPWPNCEGVGMIERELEYQDVINTTVKCNLNPEHEFCILCGNKKHIGGCLSDQEIEILRLVKSGELKLKKCPGCANWTEKKGGCNHMTCVHCKYEWCWLCNQASPPGHFEVVNTPCQGKQFKDEYVPYNEDAYFKAAEIAKNPSHPVNLALPNYQGFINNPNPIYANNWYRDAPDMNSYTMEYYARLNYTSATYAGDCEDRCCLCFGDTLMSLLMIVVNFFGNPITAMFFWRNKVVIDSDLQLNNREGFFARMSYFMYTCAMMIYWLIFLLNTAGFSVIMFLFHVFNGLISNIRRPGHVLIT